MKKEAKGITEATQMRKHDVEIEPHIPEAVFADFPRWKGKKPAGDSAPPRWTWRWWVHIDCTVVDM